MSRLQTVMIDGVGHNVPTVIAERIAELEAELYQIDAPAMIARIAELEKENKRREECLTETMRYIEFHSPKPLSKQDRQDSRWQRWLALASVCPICGALLEKVGRENWYCDKCEEHFSDKGEG